MWAVTQTHINKHFLLHMKFHFWCTVKLLQVMWLLSNCFTPLQLPSQQVGEASRRHKTFVEFRNLHTGGIIFKTCYIDLKALCFKSERLGVCVVCVSWHKLSLRLTCKLALSTKGALKFHILFTLNFTQQLELHNFSHLYQSLHSVHRAMPAPPAV